MDKIINWIDKNFQTNLLNKNIFVTGGNSGIGLSLIKHLAYLKANIFMLSRNQIKALEAKKEVLNEYPSANITIISLDLASFQSIKDCVDEVSKYDVYAFINNAGVYRLKKGSVTKENIEITMGTNFIGTLYLNDLLNKYFLTLDHPVKNILTTSISSVLFKINYNDFYNEKGYFPLRCYARSKIAINDLFYNYLDEYKDSNIIFSITHPGATFTPLILKGYRSKVFVKLATWFMKLMFHNTSKASLSDLYAIYATTSVKVGPKGLLQINGYPKLVNIKKNKRYKDSVSIGRNTIKEALNN